jgi:nucleoside-diphosphate-sugar epimerase
MRIVILGANGQVGAEVCQKLATIPGIDLVPVSRTRNGSAFLRSRGVAVWHGDPSDPAVAQRLFKGADLIANFALAGGVGKVGRLANEAIIAASVAHSPNRTKIIFFSTLAVHGVWDEAGGRSGNPYGDLKRSNEEFFARQVKRQARSGWMLRLGHVCGEEQGLSHAIRDEVGQGPVLLPDPKRPSNTIYTETICDAIMAIAEGRSSQPGLYDLVNAPQWPWQQVYEHEAALIGATLTIRTAPQVVPLKRRSATAAVFATIARLGLRQKLERALPLLPGRYAEQIRADFLVTRTAGEIAALAPPRTIRNSAAVWPALDTKPLAGLRPTAGLAAVYTAPQSRPWPPSLEAES